jgi:hypothetical protein
VEGHKAARSDCPLQGRGLAENALVRKGGEIALRFEVGVPRSREMLMLLMQRDKEHVAVADDVATPLLYSDVIVPPIEGSHERLCS